MTTTETPTPVAPTGPKLVRITNITDDSPVNLPGLYSARDDGSSGGSPRLLPGEFIDVPEADAAKLNQNSGVLSFAPVTA